MLAAAENESMKEVGGLEGRLYGLDQILVNVDKIVRDQDTLARVGYKYGLCSAMQR